MATAAQHDFAFRRRASFAAHIRLFEASNPVPLTDGDLRLSLKRGADEFADDAVQQPTLTLLAQTGVAEISFAADQRNPAGAYYYRLDRIDGDDVEPLLKGNMTIAEA